MVTQLHVLTQQSQSHATSRATPGRMTFTSADGLCKHVFIHIYICIHIQTFLYVYIYIEGERETHTHTQRANTWALGP